MIKIEFGSPKEQELAYRNDAVDLNTGILSRTNHRSFTKGMRTWIGLAGQWEAFRILNHLHEVNPNEFPEMIMAETKDEDGIWIGTTDTKAKRCTGTVNLDYNASIAVSSLHQQCKTLLFTRVLVDPCGVGFSYKLYDHEYSDNDDLQAVYVIGWMEKEEFLNRAVFKRKGESDPKRPDWLFKEDCYNLPYSELNLFPDIELKVADILIPPKRKPKILAPPVINCQLKKVTVFHSSSG